MEPSGSTVMQAFCNMSIYLAFPSGVELRESTYWLMSLKYSDSSVEARSVIFVVAVLPHLVGALQS